MTPSQPLRVKQCHCDLLDNLGFVINLKKSVLCQTQRIEFLGMIIDSVEMTVSLNQEKVKLISKRYQDVLSMQEVLIEYLNVRSMNEHYHQQH